VRDVGSSVEAKATEQAPSPARRRRRVPWARLLRRLLHVDALACPRCSTSKRSVPMVVLAFLTDPEVVEKILRHLGLPTCAPALAPAGSMPCQQLPLQQLAPFSGPALGCTVPDEGGMKDSGEDEEVGSSEAAPPDIRPPP
jgi:hypothetical protein